MIGSSFLNSSACSSEQVLIMEFPSLDCVLSDIDLQGSPNNIDSNGKWDELSSIYSGSPVHSSDDCDMMAEDFDSMLPFIDTYATQLLEEDGLIDFIDLNNLNWRSLSVHDTESTVDDTNDINFNQTKAPRKKQINTKSSKHNIKSWTKMSTKERLKIAHSLSEIVSSSSMCLQEKFQVIKLIDPTADLSPSTEEFIIKLSHLNDAKLKRICGYLNKRMSSSIDLNTLLNSSSSSSPSKVKSNRASSCHRAKRRPKKSNNSPRIDELQSREKKVIRQDKKEKRSGLFRMEMIIKKHQNDPKEEEEDVNILE